MTAEDDVDDFIEQFTLAQGELLKGIPEVVVGSATSINVGAGRRGFGRLAPGRADNLDQVVISVDDVPLRVGPRPVLALEIAASQLEGAKQCLVRRTGH